ncbi:xanthine dehydrogenase family Fe-S subunit [Salinicola peritrichatus]|uniref:xanthine dehydrogenase family Fe-S subunit n=1 Tax=Salinicola peritrichatus TaxID=1267424 RepID=UPI000DA21D3D|nr:2Fe-2S iron-sulfur cluster-binding protein [Salinicola peritrichatus]
MTATTLTINGEAVSRTIEPRQHLGDFLREQCHLTGTHLGCEHGVCGACTIIRDGRPVRSCLTWAVSCEGAQVVTIEGLDQDPVTARLRAAFSAQHALQCGFCTPGMLVSCRDIVLRHAGRTPEDRDIRHELSGNLCRCTGYDGIVRAVKEVLADEVFLAGIAPARPAALQAVSMPSRDDMKVTDNRQNSSEATTASRETEKGREITSRFTLDHHADGVWQALKDIRLVVGCLPGAELTEVDDEGHVEGFFHVRLGPISAKIAGEGEVRWDDAQRRGELEGRGRDSRSDSRANGALSFSVEPSGANRTTLDLALGFELTGTLAQFGRGGLIDDIVGSLIDQFRARLEAHLDGRTMKRASGLNPFTLFMMAMKRRLRRWTQRN